ncbi:MAG: hypothetical protein M1825_005554 [Sarcosagium campestre]|nr:MAG: hypothetical protein M1825_005554 [Sarcosagium campestre]
MWADAESPMFFRIEVDFLFALKHTQVVEYLNPWQGNIKVKVGVQDLYAYLAHLIRNTSDLGKNPFLFPDGDSVDPTTTIEEFIVFDKNADRLHPKHWSLVESRSVYVRRSDAKTSEGPKLRPGAHLPELEPRKKPIKYKKFLF